MLPGIHRTEPIGTVVQQCCGGQQKRYDLRLCESDQQPHRYCSWQLTTGGMSAIEHDGISEIAHVTSCHRCPYAERPFVPAVDIPKAQALPKMQNREVQLWMEMRARRTGDRAAEQLSRLVYCSRLGCVRELHADDLRHRTPEPLPRLDIVKRHLMYHVWPLSKARYVWHSYTA